MPVMEFGIDKDGKTYAHSISEKPLDLTAGEEEALDIVYKALSGLDTEEAEIHAARRSDNYLSVVAFGVHDFLRLKIGERSKWFSVSLSPSDRSELRDDERFSKVSNKKQLHWKVPLSSTQQLKQNADLLQRAYIAAKLSYEASLTK